MKTYRLYIGSNNETKELEHDKIIGILSSNHEGFTIANPAIGYYKGSKETNLVVEISTTKKDIMKTINELKEKLSQECIGIIEMPEMKFI